MTARARYDDAQRFLTVAPRPKLRKTRQPRPGAKVGPVAALTAYVDDDRGLVLLRGLRVGVVLDSLALREVAAWSVSAKGWVLPIGTLPDVEAYAQHLRAPLLIKPVTTGAAS